MVEAVALELSRTDRKINCCRLTIAVSLALYQQRIVSEELFELKSQLTGRMLGDPFVAELPLALTIFLNPDLFVVLERQATDAETAAHHLVELGQGQPDASLLQAENWIALSVKQQQPEGETGFRTFWDFVNLTQLASGQADVVSDLMFAAMPDFFQDSIAAGLSSLLPDDANRDRAMAATNQVIRNLFESNPDLATREGDTLKPIADSLSLLAELIPADVSEVIRRTAGQPDFVSLLETSDFFSGTPGEAPEQGAPKQRAPKRRAPKQRSILSSVEDFFRAEDWVFERVESRSILRLRFQGQNDQWLCLAEVRESLRQLVFYSIGPAKMPEARRGEVCEFLMKVNYELAVGCFDLDFDDGEVRFRTSLDVEGCELTAALIRNAVYTNVLTMDRYLPGMMAVLEGRVSVEDAIAQIKNS